MKTPTSNPITGIATRLPTSPILSHINNLSENVQTNTWEQALKTFQAYSSPSENTAGKAGDSPLFTRASTSVPLPAIATQNLSEKAILVEQKKHALLQAAQSFEALLVYQMFKAMEKNLEGDKLLGENHATKIFKDFLTSENSLLAVKSGSGSLGLAKLIYEENTKHIN